jgi:hypothetical protein
MKTGGLLWCPKNKELKPNTLGPHRPIRRSPKWAHKEREREREREQLNKRKRKRNRGKDGRPRRERERMGLKPPLYRTLSHPHVFPLIYLVRNPIPMDVGIIGRTTSNILWIVVFYLPQTHCQEVPI